jgi:transposase-like protein
MSKHSKEFKLAVINHYLSTRDGFRSMAALYEVNPAFIKKWVYALKIHG